MLGPGTSVRYAAAVPPLRRRVSWSSTWRLHAWCTPRRLGPRALWPDRPVSQATVYSTASDARRALGRTSDGAARLPCGPRLRLHCAVETDVDRFHALAPGECVGGSGPVGTRSTLRRIAPAGLGRARRDRRPGRGRGGACRVARRRRPAVLRPERRVGVDGAAGPRRQPLRRTPVPRVAASPRRPGEPPRTSCRHGTAARRCGRTAGSGAARRVGDRCVGAAAPRDVRPVQRTSLRMACDGRSTGQAVGLRPAMARSSSGKSVARAAATGGGATYRARCR